MAIQGDYPPALRGCLEACERSDQIVRALTPDQFSGATDRAFPIGGHMRHVVEHIEWFLRGLKDGVIEYDARQRDETLERDPDRLREALARCADGLREMPLGNLGDSVQIRLTVSLDSEPTLMDSTIERELAFLSSHTIHHLALVYHYCRELGVELPDDTALAFSTVAYRKAAAG